MRASSNASEPSETISFKSAPAEKNSWFPAMIASELLDSGCQSEHTGAREVIGSIGCSTRGGILALAI